MKKLATLLAGMLIVGTTVLAGVSVEGKSQAKIEKNMLDSDADATITLLLTDTNVTGTELPEGMSWGAGAKMESSKTGEDDMQTFTGVRANAEYAMEVAGGTLTVGLAEELEDEDENKWMAWKPAVEDAGMAVKFKLYGDYAMNLMPGLEVGSENNMVYSSNNFLQNGDDQITETAPSDADVDALTTITVKPYANYSQAMGDLTVGANNNLEIVSDSDDNTDTAMTLTVEPFANYSQAMGDLTVGANNNLEYWTKNTEKDSNSMALTIEPFANYSSTVDNLALNSNNTLTIGKVLSATTDGTEASDEEKELSMTLVSKSSAVYTMGDLEAGVVGTQGDDEDETLKYDKAAGAEEATTIISPKVYANYGMTVAEGVIVGVDTNVAIKTDSTQDGMDNDFTTIPYANVSMTIAEGATLASNNSVELSKKLSKLVTEGAPTDLTDAEKEMGMLIKSETSVEYVMGDLTAGVKGVLHTDTKDFDLTGDDDLDYDGGDDDGAALVAMYSKGDVSFTGLAPRVYANYAMTVMEGVTVGADNSFTLLNLSWDNGTTETKMSATELRIKPYLNYTQVMSDMLTLNAGTSLELAKDGGTVEMAGHELDIDEDMAGDLEAYAGVSYKF